MVSEILHLCHGSCRCRNNIDKLCLVCVFDKPGVWVPPPQSSQQCAAAGDSVFKLRGRCLVDLACAVMKRLCVLGETERYSTKGV